MKKIIKIFLIFITSIAMLNNYTKAEELSIEDQIKITIDNYYIEIQKNDPGQFTYEEAVELNRRVDLIKAKDPELVEQAAKAKENLKLRSAVWAYRGHVFVTGDSSKQIIPGIVLDHGHAGIGTATAEAVIESNPGDGVTMYRDRINTYWSKVNSSIMGVRNATTSNYSNAFIFANNQLGKPYRYPQNITPLNGYYCSELVFKAWDSVGKNLNGFGAVIIWPEALYVDSDTYTVVKYGTGY